MPRRSLLLLTAGVLAGGCSRDGPLVAPEMGSIEPVDAVAASLTLLPDDIEDVLNRLLPAIGPRGAALNGPLLRLQAKPKDKAALADLQRTLDALTPSLPEEARADADALRLQLGLSFPK